MQFLAVSHRYLEDGVHAIAGCWEQILCMGEVPVEIRTSAIKIIS